MGATLKTLVRLMTLTVNGELAPESAVCDIGATQLFGDAAEEGARSFLAFYAERTAKAKRPQDVSDEQFRTIAKGGFLGDLLILAGFRYTALDIFHATNTILFDLNIHAPGPRLASQFDLVMNFGTTEHVINQLRAFQTIHDLTRPQGLIYHDLPMAGYLDHALFRYDPLFFRTIVAANNYTIILREITMGPAKPVPEDVIAWGYGEPTMTDVGIEVVLRRTGAGAFNVPMEMSTSLSIDPNFGSVGASDAVALPGGTTVSYGGALDLNQVPFDDLTRAWVDRVVGGLRGQARRLGLR
jgi:SAM-dependent methyltransferase